MCSQSSRYDFALLCYDCHTGVVCMRVEVCARLPLLLQRCRACVRALDRASRRVLRASQHNDPINAAARRPWLASPRVTPISAPFEAPNVDQRRNQTATITHTVQDNDGNTNTAVVDGSAIAARLIAAIKDAGGPTYSFTEIDPVDDQDGGIPGGNIRCVFLYDAHKVMLADSAAGRAGGSTEYVTVVGEGDALKLSVNPGALLPLRERCSVSAAN
jgi:hypothetical protein